MELTAANTAIVIDSTADFPEAPERFPNWRMVPLYVRFGDESYRDYVELGPHEFYERLRTAESLPTTSQPTPGDFLACYERLGAYAGRARAGPARAPAPRHGRSRHGAWARRRSRTRTPSRTPERPSCFRARA